MAGVPPIYRQNHSAKSREWYIPATACCQAVELKMPVVFTIDPLFVGRWGGMIFSARLLSESVCGVTGHGGRDQSDATFAPRERE